MMKRNPNSQCEICSADFYCPPCRKAIGWGRFCSKPCLGTFKSGKHDKNLTYVAPKKQFNELSYSGKHMRIRREWGVATMCENCGDPTAKKYEWANLSGQYLEDKSDWRQLCTSCHVSLDHYGKELICA